MNQIIEYQLAYAKKVFVKFGGSALKFKSAFVKHAPCKEESNGNKTGVVCRFSSVTAGLRWRQTSEDDSRGWCRVDARVLTS